MGTVGSASGTITVSDSGTPGWSTNQWVNNGDPYTLIDISSPHGNGYLAYQGDVGWEITGSTSNTVMSSWYAYDGNNGVVVSDGDTYIILRASVCLDQPGRGAGVYISGDSSENTSPTPVGPIDEALDPIYEWGDTIGTSSSPGYGPFQVGTAKLLLGRDYYEETNNQAAQSNPTTPFNGTATGACGGSWTCNVGHGTFANRPTTCTQGVGYWATDQGNWNQSGSGGQGELYICTATNTWTMEYEPYVYPHPLDTRSNPTPNPGVPGAPNGFVRARPRPWWIRRGTVVVAAWHEIGHLLDRRAPGGVIEAAR
jgi:hypothetical protein